MTMKILGALGLGLTLASTALAQTSAAQASERPADARQTHYQIGVMERVLEGAVEHGAANLRERLQARARRSGAAASSSATRACGFRLDGYGLFFDVEVPSPQRHADVEPAHARSRHGGGLAGSAGLDRQAGAARTQRAPRRHRSA